VEKRSPLKKRLRKRKGCKVWTFWGYDYQGVRYETTTHQTDFEAALNAAKTIERERAAGPVAKPVKGPCTLAGAFALLAGHDVLSNARPNTVRFHTDRAAHLLRLLPSNVADINLDAYTIARLGEGADRHTIQKEHRVLRQALRLAGYDVSKYKVAGFVNSKHFYTPGDSWLEEVVHIFALLDELDPTRRDDVLAYVNTGLRRRELLTITRGRVNLTKRELYVDELDRITLKTTGAKRVLPLNDVMVSVLTRRTDGFSEWHSGNRDINAAWKRARAKLVAADADLDETLPARLTFNDLRRTFCSLMRNAGVSFEDCADLLGHEDITMVRQVYGRAASKTLKAAIAKMPSMSYDPGNTRSTCEVGSAAPAP
jgi:hypothetical protein